MCQRASCIVTLFQQTVVCSPIWICTYFSNCFMNLTILYLSLFPEYFNFEFLFNICRFDITFTNSVKVWRPKVLQRCNYEWFRPWYNNVLRVRTHLYNIFILQGFRELSTNPSPPRKKWHIGSEQRSDTGKTVITLSIIESRLETNA